MMQKRYIRLSSVELVKQFVDDISGIEGNFELISGRYVIDAKSIMGVFSLDLSNPLQLIVDSSEQEKLIILEKYIVEL